MTLAEIMHELLNPANRLHYNIHGDRDPKKRDDHRITRDYDDPISVRIDDVWMTFYSEKRSAPYVTFTIDTIRVATYNTKDWRSTDADIRQGSVTWEMQSPALVDHVTKAAQTLFDRCMATKTRMAQEEQARINRDRIAKDMNRAALMDRFGVPGAEEVARAALGPKTTEENPLESLERRLRAFKSTV